MDTAKFASDLKLVLNTLQLLKYNAESFRSLDIHKEIKAGKGGDMKTPTAKLLNALNAYLLEMRMQASNETWRIVMSHMKADHLHDLNVHFAMMQDVVNISEITELLRTELKFEPQS